MSRMWRLAASAGGLCLASIAVLAAGGQITAPAGFTAAQATAGQQIYAGSCASCHGPDMRGGNEAPPLAGVTSSI